ncbi:MAG TPA: 3-deoxy-8-phosphooctulonate synthase, partial [bacterium]
MNEVSQLGKNGKFFVIAGPCVVEGTDFLLKTARIIKGIADELRVPLVFKSSYDKANRTSVKGFRGPGLKEGLKALAMVKKKLGLPVLTDVHEISEVKAAAKVADVLQIPAFLSRQTSLLMEAAKHGEVVNVKKAQFMAPWEMANVVEKMRKSGQKNIWLTERGTVFGYNNLVVDYRGIPEMQKT